MHAYDACPQVRCLVTAAEASQMRILPRKVIAAHLSTRCKECTIFRELLPSLTYHAFTGSAFVVGFVLNHAQRGACSYALLAALEHCWSRTRSGGTVKPRATVREAGRRCYGEIALLRNPQGVSRNSTRSIEKGDQHCFPHREGERKELDQNGDALLELPFLDHKSSGSLY